MSTRRQALKEAAKKRLRKNYWLMVVLCVFSGMIGLSHSASISSIKSLISGPESEHDAVFSSVLVDVLKGDFESGDANSKKYLDKHKNYTENVGFVTIQHAKGVFADLTNDFSSGQIVVSTFASIQNAVGTKNIAIFLMILLVLLILVVVYIFIMTLFQISYVRVILESRIYDKVPLRRFLFYFKSKQWFHITMVVLRKNIYLGLWFLTIVGGIIKSYSYAMVPYIVAENPTISGKEAIQLSREMMDGHKWELFVFKLSFLGWLLLEYLTAGFLGIFFLNPYTELANAEFFVFIRQEAKEKNIHNSQLLNDTYLYEFASEELLRETYQDALPTVKKSEKNIKRNGGIRGFFENTFGITLFYDRKEQMYERNAARKAAAKEYIEIFERKSYPLRLHMVAKAEKIKVPSNIHYDRHYSIASILLIFSTICCLGWCWEVSYHLFRTGRFVNRGVLHGPWLPIYGTGCIMILIILNKLRKHPLLEFGGAVVLCGVVEYITSWFLETTHGGMKWWDYSGYYLNIHGRVCAEGLLLFGLGGIFFVYILAPFLDNIFRMIPKKIAITIAIIFFVVFMADEVYSIQHPNAGRGITKEKNQYEKTKKKNVKKVSMKPISRIKKGKFLAYDGR